MKASIADGVEPEALFLGSAAPTQEEALLSRPSVLPPAQRRVCDDEKD